MRKDLTDLTVIVDRSGSMNDCAMEASNGINNFIEEQKKAPGECLATLVQFDTKYEFIHQGVPLSEVKPYELVPGGMTALLDAVGRSINETGKRLAAMTEKDRPGLVVFLIVTDGEENSSHEFSLEAVREMIEKQQKDYNWKFTFLGADHNAFAAGASMGIAAAGVAQFSKGKTDKAYSNASSNVMRMRRANLAGQAVTCSYSAEERDDMQ